MIYNVLSVNSSDNAQERYINYFELYHEQYRRNHLHALRQGYHWEHEDVVEVTERYCEQNARRLINESSDYSERILLVVGPRQLLLDRVYSELRIGNEYQIEIVIFDSSIHKNTAIGRLDLKSYIKINDLNTGGAVLEFENDERLPLHSMEIGDNQELCLRVKGAIRILSSIDYIIQVQE
tara:strand:+ start:755 stop:1294 length:540 start_codon:yes stop_codon:yes gene_type:complete